MIVKLYEAKHTPMGNWKGTGYEEYFEKRGHSH